MMQNMTYFLISPALIANTVETLYNEVLGTGKFCYISSQKQYITKHIDFIGTREYSLLYQVFRYIRSLYIEFPLYLKVIKMDIGF